MSEPVNLLVLEAFPIINHMIRKEYRTVIPNSLFITPLRKARQRVIGLGRNTLMKTELIVPVYIDTNALLDLIASIEGGFSLVEKVTTRTTAITGSERSVSGEAGVEFGVPNVLNLLKLRLGSAWSSTKQRETGEEKESERYHTYGSLLHRLRSFLGESNFIKRPDESSGIWDEIVPSDFVEIRGVFQPNPIVDFLENIDRFLEILEIFPNIASSSSGQLSGTHKKGSQEEVKKQVKQFRQFCQGILKNVEARNTRIFVVSSTGPISFQTVILLFIDYLRDKTMAEISYKEYRLLGKVVRKADTGETIDLLRGTVLGGISKELLEQLWSSINSQRGPINLPAVKSEINGPALEVVPIAIFV